MFSQVSAQLRQRADRLLSGQYDWLAAHYVYPLPLYLGPSRLIVRSRDEAVSMLCLLRAAYLERGVIALQPRVTAVDLPRDGRFRVWVDWHELAIPAEHSRQSSVIYYCRTSGPGLRVEMVQYTRLSMPELSPHFASLALSA
ncbi:MAG TPA: hypothetical protein PLM52_12030 [Tabrizicola sp.]|nr:hypothetical protein [Tabrizicola sp.]